MINWTNLVHNTHWAVQKICCYCFFSRRILFFCVYLFCFSAIYCVFCLFPCVYLVCPFDMICFFFAHRPFDSALIRIYSLCIEVIKNKAIEFFVRKVGYRFLETRGRYLLILVRWRLIWGFYCEVWQAECVPKWFGYWSRNNSNL